MIVMTALLVRVKEVYNAIAALPEPNSIFEEISSWIEMTGGPYGGEYNTSDEIAGGVFANIASDWANFTFSPEIFMEADGYVFVVGNYTGVNKATGKSLQARVVHMWSRKAKGKLCFEQFADTALLRNAMQN